ncbi:hypothetical protein [Halobacteriovorax sp. HLS]|uniref:hypothetical protein n=1 Tax=Halobacteriovorax sp. HLS TaxID=2234000 RepID=UPI000FD6D553|nr:hypothetical protein [Halobacteriovorax sp. HLS]
MSFKALLVITVIFITSCKSNDYISSNLSGDTEDIQKFTKDFTTIPSAHEVSEHINETLSAPQSDCIPKAIVVAPPAPEPSKKNDLCNYPEMGKSWVSNCNKLYEAGIPHDALNYTLKAFKNNFDKFRNNKCYIYTDKKGEGPKKEFTDSMKNGIPNKCQIVINNTKEEAEKFPKSQYPFRRKMYYIDICKGEVKTSYFNLGSGTFKSNYANISGKHSTVKGVFMTGTNVFNFVPGGKKSIPKYNAVRSYMKKTYGESKAHGLQLFGLQKTNNGSGPDSKYMHVSPYKSSWGCPSIDKDNYWMIENLAKNGPSMVVNYGDGMQDIEDVNDCGPRK